ncbi:flagellar hook-associated protein FlgK [Alkalihalobacterium bogoriense]|uniref:flagellar hook-associated protein FlgK n=1 Tax=Alkalihalobacterium bogoriense TaxID=246272 RepID=UPI000478A494|nr:flagellar hook-associated protein FlgK [Alkalihalobacterium bogoriense]
MTSTFHALETARRAMTTQQYALHTTGHNIANANTPGYTRQRVNFEQTQGFPTPSVNSPMMPGQLGTGVQAGSVQRVRESFLDLQFREESSKFGYWAGRFESLQRMEDIMNEPSEHGLANTIDRFWQSLQDLAVNPEDAGARSVVVQRGEAVADTFRYAHDSLSALRRDIGHEIGEVQNEVNSLLQQINDLNKKIGETEPHGYVPNDLYDERDRLVDRLSGLVSVQTENVRSGGKASPVAEGRMTVYLVDNSGNRINPPLVNGSDPNLVNGINVTQTNGVVDKIQVGELNDRNEIVTLHEEFNGDEFKTFGKLKGLIEAYGYAVPGADGNLVVKGIYPEMLSDLDIMAFTFASEFNKIHESGWSLSEINSGQHVGYQFFSDTNNGAVVNVEGYASRIRVSDEIRQSPDNIAASGAPVNGQVRNEAFAGDGSNAVLLANMKDVRFNINGATTNIQGFYRSVIGEMAVDTAEAARRQGNSQTLLTSIQMRKDSVSSVSLDEELTNMIQFQHAYNAAARNITLVDEMLDRIINGMGIVGR